MTTSQVSVYAIPGKVLNSSRIDIPALMKELLGTELRIQRGINPETELRRLQLLNDRVEAAVMDIVIGKKVDILHLGPAYLDALISMYDHDSERALRARIGASVYPRAYILSHVQEFDRFAHELGLINTSEIQARQDFLRRAAKRKLTVFELQRNFCHNPTVAAIASQANIADMLEKLARQYGEIADVPDEVTQIAGEGEQERLISQILSALDLTTKGKLTRVSFSAQRNDIIAEVLHSFVYGSGAKHLLHIAYADGSEAPPFPVYCLQQRSEREMQKLRSLPELRMGLLSERHPEMDHIVHKYWFRNSVVSIGKPHGEIDQQCYEMSKEIFEAIRAEGIYRIAMFQTGLEPANVGFYRALVEELIFRAKGKPTLEVTPYYFVEGVYVQGLPWN